jgi:hypothetical protein
MSESEWDDVVDLYLMRRKAAVWMLLNLGLSAREVGLAIPAIKTNKKDELQQSLTAARVQELGKSYQKELRRRAWSIARFDRDASTRRLLAAGAISGADKSWEQPDFGEMPPDAWPRERIRPAKWKGKR